MEISIIDSTIESFLWLSTVQSNVDMKRIRQHTKFKKYRGWSKNVWYSISSHNGNQITRFALIAATGTMQVFTVKMMIVEERAMQIKIQKAEIF